MSSIYIETLLDALSTPSTLKALERKTGYPVDRVLKTIAEARAAGHNIVATPRDGERTYYWRYIPSDDTNPND